MGEETFEVIALKAEIERLTIFEKAHPQLQKTLDGCYKEIERLKADIEKAQATMGLMLEEEDRLRAALKSVATHPDVPQLIRGVVNNILER